MSKKYIDIDILDEYIEKQMALIDNMPCTVSEKLLRTGSLMKMKIDVAEMPEENFVVVETSLEQIYNDAFERGWDVCEEEEDNGTYFEARRENNCIAYFRI